MLKMSAKSWAELVENSPETRTMLRSGKQINLTASLLISDQEGRALTLPVPHTASFRLLDSVWEITSNFELASIDLDKLDP